MIIVGVLHFLRSIASDARRMHRDAVRRNPHLSW